MKSATHRIFVVDDDEDDRDLLYTAFSQYGLANDVQLVASERELFAELESLSEKNLPRLIILDHQTPGQLGSDTLSLLKTSEKYKHVPVAIYSSALTAGMIDELLKKQAAVAMVKAATLEEYQQHIATFDRLAQ